MTITDCYADYLRHLLRGERAACADLVGQLLAAGVPIRTLYQDLFRASLYEVGELWETNRISVATEHLATATTESLLSRVVAPMIFAHAPAGRTLLVSCAANEFHQVGGRMVADLAELRGWDTRFVGANTPAADLLKLLEQRPPDVLGLSCALLGNLPHVRALLESVRKEFPALPVWLGGQMFRWGGHELAREFPGVCVFTEIEIYDAELTRLSARADTR